MKTLLLSALLLPLAGHGAPSRETIAFHLEEGNTLIHTFEATGDSQIDSISMSVDGDVVQEVDDIDFSSTSLERVVMRDTVIEVDEGRATDFRRSYSELHQEGSQAAGDEDDIDSVSICDMEGVSIRFLWDDDDEAYYAELDDEEDDVTDDDLEWLNADIHLSGMLPDDEVEEGDSWDIDASAYLPLMWPGGLVSYVDEETEEFDEFDQAVNRMIIENLTGEGTVTFEEIRDEDGTRVAVLHIELEVESSAESEREGEEDEEPTTTITIEIERDVEGEILWDLDNGHLYSAAIEADSTWERAETQEIEHEGTEYEVGRTYYSSGTISYEVTVERE